MVPQAAKASEKTCLAIVEQVGKYLGLGLANLVNLFNPSMIVLDQSLGLACNELLDQIVRVIRRQALRYSTDNLTVRFARLGIEGSTLGVGSMVLDKRFEIPALKPPRFMVESVTVHRNRQQSRVA
jgi:predicted NBD/HSP70 family sugar kinase